MTVTEQITADDAALDELAGATVEEVAGATLDEQAGASPDEVAGATATATPATPADSSEAETGFELAIVSDRLTAVDAKLSELADRLDATEAAAQAIRVRSESIEETGAETANKLIGTDRRLDTAESAVVHAQEALSGVVGRLELVDSRLDSLGDQLAAIGDRQADHDRALTEVTRTIATEVERHTTDALVNTQHSLQLAVNSIAQLSLAMAESASDLTEDVSADSATTLLDSFRVDLDAILLQLGFSSLGTTVGDVFDPHRHRALKRVATADPAKDKSITTVIRDGYLSIATGRILLFADVEVSRHRP